MRNISKMEDIKHYVHNPAFFQHFWTNFSDATFQSCCQWLSLLSFLGLNFTNIVVILKTQNLTSMKYMRSISLCNVLYKTMVKVLENCLKVISSSIISKSQLAFGE